MQEVTMGMFNLSSLGRVFIYSLSLIHRFEENRKTVALHIKCTEPNFLSLAFFQYLFLYTFIGTRVQTLHMM